MDVGEMQKKLSQWATENPEDQYRDLYSLLCNETWLRVAHHSVNTNQGRETAGIDGQSMSNFNGDVDGNIHRLTEALKAKNPMDADRLANLQVLCTECHRAKTKSDLKVLSRMR